MSPINIEQGMIFFRLLVNKREVWGVLDNAATSTIVDVGLAQELGLTVEDRKRKIATTFSSTKQSRVKDVSLVVPDQFSINIDLNGADLSTFSETIGRDVDLILGADLLKYLSYIIDGKRSLIIFSKTGGITIRRSGVTIIDVADDGAISAEINGKPAKLKLDLGSNNDLMIYEGSWSKFFDAEDEVPLGRSVDMSGQVLQLTGVKGIRLTLPPFDTEVDVKRISFNTKGVDGLLGFSMFRDKVAVFDLSAGKIIVYPE